MKYILDTNAFWDILRKWNSSESSLFLTKLRENELITFGLSEISTMEIYSVIGNCARQMPQNQKCTRKVTTDEGIKDCPFTWTTKTLQKRLNDREVQAIIRMIDDILKKRHSTFDVKVIPLNSEIIEFGSNLLHKYAYKFDFHSLDAIISATAIKSSSTLITFDKALKNVLKEEGINVE
jgi:predicted nucleic acid-binding protein